MTWRRNSASAGGSIAATAGSSGQRKLRIQFRNGSHDARPIPVLPGSRQLESSFRLINADPMFPSRERLDARTG